MSVIADPVTCEYCPGVWQGRVSLNSDETSGRTSPATTYGSGIDCC